MNAHVQALCDAVGVDTSLIVELRITPRDDGIRVGAKYLVEKDGRIAIPLAYGYVERTV